MQRKLSSWFLGVFVIVHVAWVCRAQDSTLAISTQARDAKIAYNASSDLRKREDILVVNEDGSGFLQLTPDSKLYSRWNCCPAWSPDGTELAFVSEDRRQALGKTHSTLYALKPGTEALRRLLRDDTVCMQSPAWSPDGKRLILTRDIESHAFRFDVTNKWPCTHSHLFSINVDGSGLQQLTHQAGGLEDSAAWSPDGGTIVYVSRPLSNYNRKGDIHIMRPDGSNFRALTHGGPDENNANPAWSPESMEIAFTSNRDGDYEIYAMRPDESGIRQVTHGSKGHYAQHPAWSPDGHRIAFSSSEGQYLPSIYVMNADGTDLHVLVKVGWHPAFGKGVDR